MESHELEQKLEYPKDVLMYLKNKLDASTIHCFKLVVEASNDSENFGIGLLRTKIPDFNEKRRTYDLGFTILEAQGFIRTEKIGTFRPSLLTVRGKQLYSLLKEEGQI